jgi:hypothetical protein
MSCIARLWCFLGSRRDQKLLLITAKPSCRLHVRASVEHCAHASPLMWTIPTLNTRETATVIWSAVLVLFVLRSIPSTRATALSLFKSAVSGGIRWLVLGSLIYVAAVIYGLEATGYWRTDMIGETAFWFLGGAAFGMPRAISRKWMRPKVILRQLFAVSAGLEFLANVHTFLLPVELALVSVLAALDAMAALVKVQPKLKDAEKPMAVVTNFAVAAVLGLSVIYIVVHLARFETAEYLRVLLLPLILTIVIVPLVCALRLIILWQSALMMLKKTYLADRPELYRYVTRRAFQLCGISLRRADLFEKDYWRRLRGAQGEDEVEAVLSDFHVKAESDATPQAVQDGIEWDEALGGGLNLRGVLARSVASASLKEQALEKAGTALGEPLERMKALADRLDQGQGLISAIGPIDRAQLIRVLAERSRSVAEIELMAGEIGRLAVLEGVDVRWLADRFDAVLSAWGSSAEQSNATASELHLFACNTTVALADVIDASIALAKWDGKL